MASARLAPARTSPSIRANSSDSGPGHGGDRAVERLLEAEAGLDADRQQVEDVGQLDAQIWCWRSCDPPVEDARTGRRSAPREQEQHEQLAEPSSATGSKTIEEPDDRDDSADDVMHLRWPGSGRRRRPTRLARVR